MARRAPKIPIFLTPEQIREAYNKLMEAEGGDWMDDPAILGMLERREREVMKEVKDGNFVTLDELRKTAGK